MMKPRLALDLDDIERKLRQAEQAVAPKSDPLAELARIVGQDDPFHTLLADKPQQGRIEPTFTTPPPPAADPAGRGRAAPLRAFPPAASAAAPVHAYEPAPDAYASTDFSHIVEEAAAYDHAGQEPSYAEAAPRRARKGLITVAAVLAATAVGVTGALMMRTSGGARVSGEPPVVKADVAPMKVQPQTPGGTEIPNINKQLYERGAQDTQTRIVSREEQPIDVRQAARDAAPAASPSGPASLTSVLGEPRRVRTVSIKPDGTVIPPESTPAPRPAQTVAVAAPPPVPPVAVRPAPVTAPMTMPAPSTTASAAPVAPAAAPRLDPRTTSTPQPRAAEPARQAAASPATAAAAPATPDASRAPKPQARVAAVAPPEAAEVPKPIAPRAGEGAGGYAVQLGVRTSEDDARAAFKQLQQKFTDLGGRSPTVQQAESNGKTIYRVRVSGMAKDDATGLCERLKSSGGQCFVTKN
jgi:hypothetical protein